MSRWTPPRVARAIDRRARRGLRRVSAAIDPSAWLLGRRGHCPPARLACVYRSTNAHNVAALVVRADEVGWSIRLWALDATHPDLEALTVGAGPGTRFGLLNILLEGLDPEEYAVVADDDITLTRGSLDTAVKVADRYRLDLGGIAHGRGSFHNHEITVAVPFSVARLTTFVEIGPVVIVAPAIRDRMLPFPDIGMGWGVDVEWSALAAEGHRLGIIDVVQLRHLQPTGAAYDLEEERARTLAQLEQAATTWTGIRRTLQTIRLWTPRPAADPGGQDG